MGERVGGGKSGWGKRWVDGNGRGLVGKRWVG